MKKNLRMYLTLIAFALLAYLVALVIESMWAVVAAPADEIVDSFAKEFGLGVTIEIFGAALVAWVVSTVIERGNETETVTELRLLREKIVALERLVEEQNSVGASSDASGEGAAGSEVSNMLPGE
jgi:hypothetical protein